MKFRPRRSELFIIHCNKVFTGEDRAEEGKHRDPERDSEGRDHEQGEQVHDPVPHRAAPRHPRPEQRLQRDDHRQESRAFNASLIRSSLLHNQISDF